MSGQFDTVTGAGSARIQQLGTEGLDTSWVDANRLAATDVTLGGYLSGEDGRSNASLNLGRVTGDGLTVSSPMVAPQPQPVDGPRLVGTLAGRINWPRQCDRWPHPPTPTAAQSMGTNPHQATIGSTTLTDLAQETFSAQTLSTTNTSLTADAQSHCARRPDERAGCSDENGTRPPVGVRRKHHGAARASPNKPSSPTRPSTTVWGSLRRRYTARGRANRQWQRTHRIRVGPASDRVTGATIGTGSLSNAAVHLDGETYCTRHHGTGEHPRRGWHGRNLKSASSVT